MYRVYTLGDLAYDRSALALCSSRLQTPVVVRVSTLAYDRSKAAPLAHPSCALRIPTEAAGSLNVHRVHRLRLPHPTTTVWDAGCPDPSVMLGPYKALRLRAFTLPRSVTVA